MVSTVNNPQVHYNSSSLISIDSCTLKIEDKFNMAGENVIGYRLGI